MSFKSGVILILLSAAAWGLGGVCGQFLYQFHSVTAPWLIAVRQVLAGFIFLGYLLLRGENIFRIFADKRDTKDQLAFSFLGFWARSLVFITPFRCAMRQRQRCCNILRRCLLCCG